MSPVSTGHRVGNHPTFEDSHSKPCPDQLEHLAIRHPLFHFGDDGVEPKAAEAVRDVSVKHPDRSLVGGGAHKFESLLPTAEGAP